MINIKRLLNKDKAIINKELDRFLPKANTRPRMLHRAMRYSVFGASKRIRPILTLEACRACIGTIEDAIRPACAIELVHTYSLIHDDLPSMDNDDYRRGKQSCHRRFGQASAILAGDALLTRAFEIMALGGKVFRMNRAILELSKSAGSAGMVGGQEIDLKEKSVLTKQKLDFIAKNKTAALFEASLRLGAVSAGAGKRKENALARFGLLLGMSFQLVDDYFDNDGYVRIIGKDKTIAEALRLIGKAKSNLDIFGKDAVALKGIASLVINRNKQ